MNTPIDAALAALKSDDGYAVARARALVTVYHEKWGQKWLSEFDIIDAEVEFNFPLLNPESGSPSRTFNEGGKIDVLARRRGTNRLVVIEHKTTADSVEPDSDYWDRLRMDTQISKYFLAAAHMNLSDRLGDVDNVIYDVMRKPGQRPCLVPDRDEQGLKIVLDRDGNRVFTANGKKPRETADTDKGWVVKGHTETPDEFETRLLEVLRSAPDSYYAQREAPRTDADILEYMEDAWAAGQQILYFRNKGLWSRNPEACDQMGKCEMLDLCCGRASVDGIRFRVRDTQHPELNTQVADMGASGGTRELLTTSRTKAFNRCRRLHKLKYEDRIEKVVSLDEQEALHLGTLVHKGLEIYFTTIKLLQKPTE